MDPKKGDRDFKAASNRIARYAQHIPANQRTTLLAAILSRSEGINTRDTRQLLTAYAKRTALSRGLFYIAGNAAFAAMGQPAAYGWMPTIWSCTIS